MFYTVFEAELAKRCCHFHKHSGGLEAVSTDNSSLSVPHVLPVKTENGQYRGVGPQKSRQQLPDQIPGPFLGQDFNFTIRSAILT